MTGGDFGSGLVYRPLVRTIRIALFTFGLAAFGFACKSGTMQDIKSGAKDEACKQSCDEARTKCQDACEKDLEADKDACKLACDTAKDKCASECNQQG